MRTILFSTVLILIVLISCKKGIEKTQYHFPIIELNHCSDTVIDGRTIQVCLDSVHDGRCPINAECIWEGEAIVDLSINADGQHKTFKNGYAECNSSL